MFNKPNDYLPNGNTGLVPTKVIQSNPTGNILGSLTTIAQEGGFGAIDTSHRSMIYLSPSMTVVANRLGAHEFRGGADLYPNIENDTSTQASPVEWYFRPPGTTGSQDVLFERDTLRSIDGSSSSVANKAYEHAYGAYFQDRWKPSSKVSIKAGVRVENNRIFTQDREKVLGGLLPPGVPTNISDEEFHQWVTMPNFGIAYNADRWGVFRGTANRGYEWLDLGGGDGTSHAPYVLATDIARANPRTSPTLNQLLPGGFPIGLNFGGTADDRIHNGRTYVNEFSGSWEHRLPRSSSFTTTFVLRRNWDYQSGDDLNVIRDPVTGALIGRPFPQYDTIRNTYNPNYTWQEQRSLQFLFTRNFIGGWGMNANYSYIMASTFRTRWNPTSDQLQFYGISPEDVTSQRTAPRNHGRVSTFVKLPFDMTFSAFYIYTGPEPIERDDRHCRLERDGAIGDAVERTRRVGSVLQRRLPARAQERRGHAHGGRFASREHPAGEGSGVCGRTPADAERRRLQSLQRRRVDRVPVGGCPVVELRHADQLRPGARRTDRPAADVLIASRQRAWRRLIRAGAVRDSLVHLRRLPFDADRRDHRGPGVAGDELEPSRGGFGLELGQVRAPGFPVPRAHLHGALPQAGDERQPEVAALRRFVDHGLQLPDGVGA